MAKNKPNRPPRRPRQRDGHPMIAIPVTLQIGNSFTISGADAPSMIEMMADALDFASTAGLDGFTAWLEQKYHGMLCTCGDPDEAHPIEALDKTAIRTNGQSSTGQLRKLLAGQDS